jgi:hypothetical protein
MTRYTFEIDTDNAIRIWDSETPNEGDAPFMFQPDWPDVTPWADAAQATDWAEVFIASLVDAESEFVAGDSPDTHPALRPEPEPEEEVAP